ncbi:uncharacterized protein [Chiloscyllium punctatum]|uniref:uncharacterized protein n=1 Tax=Chiloscyllium punctatum TaxID=137246 RepID=UPI003B63B41F
MIQYFVCFLTAAVFCSLGAAPSLCKVTKNHNLTQQVCNKRSMMKKKLHYSLSCSLMPSQMKKKWVVSSQPLNDMDNGHCLASAGISVMASGASVTDLCCHHNHDHHVRAQAVGLGMHGFHPAWSPSDVPPNTATGHWGPPPSHSRTACHRQPPHSPAILRALKKKRKRANTKEEKQKEKKKADRSRRAPGSGLLFHQLSHTIY